MCTNYYSGAGSAVTNQVAFLQSAYNSFAARGNGKNHQTRDRMRRWSSDSTLTSSSFTEPPQWSRMRSKNKVLPKSNSTMMMREDDEEELEERHVDNGLYGMPQRIISEPVIRVAVAPAMQEASSASNRATGKSRLRRYENGSQILDLFINRKPSRGLSSSACVGHQRSSSKLEAIAWLGGSNIVVFRSLRQMKNNSQTRYILGERLPTTPATNSNSTKPVVRLQRHSKSSASSSCESAPPKVKETFLFVGSSHAFRVMMQERLNQLEQETKSAEEAATNGAKQQQQHPRRNSIHESFTTSIPHPKMPVLSFQKWPSR